MSDAAARSRCWAAAPSAARSLRLLTEQADDLAARVGAPLELVGHRRAAGRDRAPRRRPRDLFTTDAARWSPGTTSTSSSRSSAASSRPATLLLEALRGRQARGHRQQGAARRGRRRRCTPRPPRPASTSTTRPRWPARSRCCARCASRWPATGVTPGRSASSTAPPTTSSSAMDETGAGFAEALAEATGARLRRGRPDRRRRGLRRRRQGRDPRRRWPSTPGSPPPTCTARASPTVTAADVAARRGDGLRRQAAGHLRAGPADGTATRSASACTRR